MTLADRKFVLLTVLVVAIVVILAGAAYYLSLPKAPVGPPSTACSGSQAYSGTVLDTAGAGLGGVVLALSPTSPNVGTYANVTTAPDGSWSASLSGACAYTAAIYWQSASTGPSLGSAGNLAATSTLHVNVSRQTVDLQFVKEFPNTAGLNVSLYLPSANLTFFVAANPAGTMPLGFLQQDASGAYGMAFGAPAGLNVSGTSPYALTYGGATAYNVVASSGISVVYAAPTSTGTFSVANATEALNMTQAILYAQQNGSNPYQTVGARSGTTVAVSLTNVSHVGTGVAATVFGVPLSGFFTVGIASWPGAFAKVPLSNPGGGTLCFVVWADALNLHAWYYGTGKCP